MALGVAVACGGWLAAASTVGCAAGAGPSPEQASIAKSDARTSGMVVSLDMLSYKRDGVKSLSQKLEQFGQSIPTNVVRPPLPQVSGRWVER